MSYDNRLTAEQMDALAPGDSVTVETWPTGWREPEIDTGTVVRLTATQIVVSRLARSGDGSYEERYRRKDGYRTGSASRAQLIDPEHQRSVDTMTRIRRRHRQAHIESLALQWKRNPDDLDVLRSLQAAIGEYLDAEDPPS